MIRRFKTICILLCVEILYHDWWGISGFLLVLFIDKLKEDEFTD
jgi:hypothetical protein